MANYCLCECTVIGDEGQLRQLNQIMDDFAIGRRKPLASDWGRFWLGNIVDALGGDWMSVRCKGVWSENVLASPISKGGGRLDFMIEHAWEPPYGLLELIEKRFPGLRVFFFSEECGDRNYLTNDLQGTYYHTRWLVDYCIGDEGAETIFCDSLEEALGNVASISNRPICSLMEAKEFADSFLESDGQSYCDVYPVRIVSIRDEAELERNSLPA